MDIAMRYIISFDANLIPLTNLTNYDTFNLKLTTGFREFYILDRVYSWNAEQNYMIVVHVWLTWNRYGSNIIVAGHPLIISVILYKT